MPAPKSALITVMSRAAQKAARSLLRDFGEVEHLQVSRKGPSDFVSTADTKAEKILRYELESARPDFGFLLEESGKSDGKDSNTRWIVDPLDGTHNFLHGIPFWCIAIALEEKGEITAGLVYAPVADEMFWAEKGTGAYMNSQRLRVSGRRNLADAMIGMGTPGAGVGDHDKFISELKAVMAVTAGTRRQGAAALDMAYVAAGRLDAFWENNLSPWDVAASTLIVREAGGFVTETDGGKDPVYGGCPLASNGHLHQDLLRLFSGGATRKAAGA